MSAFVTEPEHNLDEFRKLIESRSGIFFDESRERFFSSRIREHLKKKGLTSDELMRLILSSNGEYNDLLQRLLTQATFFFRHPAVFQAMRQRILPELSVSKAAQSPKRLRIWSAGCATGEEPYSVAITVLESLAFAEAWQIEIFAADISRPALAHAARGCYSRRSLGNLTPEQIATYFSRVGDEYEIKPNVRGLVKFIHMNLTDPLYVGRMDCIFCMNVLMYFSEEKRQSVVQRLYGSLEPGGYLLLGYAESLANVPVRLERIVFDDYLLYRKPLGTRSPGAEYRGT